MKIGAKIVVSQKKVKKKSSKNIEDPNVDTGQFEDVTDEEVLRNIPD
jgi:hypothetical protein